MPHSPPPTVLPPPPDLRSSGRSARTDPGISVPREIDGDQRVRLRDAFAEVAPEASRLGEAVEDDQRRSGPAHVDMEGHAR